MYRLSDKPAAIREVQKFLHVISDKVDTKIPRVAIDGIYGTETVEAVKTFQHLYGLIIDGKVDRTTFDAFFAIYSDVLRDMHMRDYIITEIGFPITVGSQSNDVLFVHLIMIELAKTYPDMGIVSRSTYYSEESKRSAAKLQKIFGMTPSGEVDALFLERMLTELDALHRLREVYE